jgi:hypothetical protein
MKSGSVLVTVMKDISITNTGNDLTKIEYIGRVGARIFYLRLDEVSAITTTRIFSPHF